MEEAGDEVALREGGEFAVKEHPARGEEAEEQRESHAEGGDDHAWHAYLFELFEVGVQPRREHDEDDAYLGEEGEPFHGGGGEDGLSRDVADEPEQDARDDHAHHLGQPEFFAEDGKELRHHEDECKRQQQFVDVHKCLPSGLPAGRISYTLRPRASQAFARKMRGARANVNESGACARICRMRMRRQACQTGIIRTRFRAADFRLNRVIRFANTVKY